MSEQSSHKYAVLKKQTFLWKMFEKKVTQKKTTTRGFFFLNQLTTLQGQNALLGVVRKSTQIQFTRRRYCEPKTK